MTNTLVYIYDLRGEVYNEDRASAERRIKVAQGLGFRLFTICNTGYKSAEAMKEFEAEVAGRDGVWADVEMGRSGINTQQLIRVAVQAGKKVIGPIYPEESIPDALVMYFGRPETADQIDTNNVSIAPSNIHPKRLEEPDDPCYHVAFLSST